MRSKHGLIDNFMAILKAKLFLFEIGEYVCIWKQINKI